MTTNTKVTCYIIMVFMLIFWAYGLVHAPGMVYIRESMVPFWGKFVWTDVTAGFILMATIITAYEGSVVFGVVMFLLMNIFGSIAIAAWLLWRGAEFYTRIRPGNLSRNTAQANP